MDILDLLDNNTLKLINSSSSYTFQGKKYFYFDRDYTDDFKNALYYWENDNISNSHPLSQFIDNLKFCLFITSSNY